MSHGKVSGEERIKRRQRDIDIVALRTQGFTLDAIAKSLDPPLSFQRIQPDRRQFPRRQRPRNGRADARN